MPVGGGRLLRVRLAPAGARPSGAAARLTLVAVAVGALLLFPIAAWAHPFLVRTVPRAGERLPDGPTELVLQFSEAISGGERLALRTFDGRAVPLGPVERLPGGAGMRAAVPALVEGAYLVAWQMLGRDGDLAAGEFAFGVGSTPLAATGAASAAVAWPNAVASGLFLGGLVVALGGLASELFVWRPLAQQYGLAVPGAPVVAGLLAALAGAAATFGLLVAARADASGGLLDGRSWVGALATRPGGLAAVGLLLVAYALWIVPMRALRGWALLPLGGAALAAAWRGHSGLSSEAGLWWAAPANALHLLGAGVWVGALVHLVLVLWRGPRQALQKTDLLRGEAARRYAGLALPTALLVLGGGVAAAAAELGALSQLVETTYGRVLLLKLLFVAAVLALALAARRRALPGDARRGVRLLRRLTAAEVAALVAVLAVTGVLVNTAPPRAASAEADLLGPPPLEAPLRLAGQAGDLSVFLAAAEGQLEVRVVPTSDAAPRNARLTLAGTSPTGDSMSLYPRPCGPGCVSMGFDWPSGTTALRVTASADDWQGGSVAFGVPWPPLPEDPALLERVATAMRAQPRVWITERVSSGPTATAGGVPYPMDGPALMAIELYTASGATDIRPLPSDDPAVRVLTFFLPGSAIWYRQELDPRDRLVRETIVNPGHLIERTFAYGLDPP